MVKADLSALESGGRRGTRRRQSGSVGEAAEGRVLDPEGEEGPSQLRGSASAHIIEGASLECVQCQAINDLQRQTHILPHQCCLEGSFTLTYKSLSVISIFSWDTISKAPER